MPVFLYAYIVLIIQLISVGSACAQSTVDPHICKNEMAAGQELAALKGHGLSELAIDPNHPEVAVLSGVVTEHFIDLINALPTEVTTLALELPRGGEAFSGLRVAELVRAKGLSTYVGLTTCHSACTLIYQGGRARTADPSALFSYHGPSSSSGDSACEDELRRGAVELMMSYGLSPEAIPFFSSHTQYNYVSGGDLIELGVAHQLESRNYGKDQMLRDLREARYEFCQKYPDNDDC